MKLSYLITASTETDTLKRLLSFLVNVINFNECKDLEQEMVILVDSKDDLLSNCPEETRSIIFDISKNNPKIVEVYNRELNLQYGEQKNFGISKCEGRYILQFDGDELPGEGIVGENFYEIIKANPTIEAFAFGRINDFRGVTEHHASQWGWRLSKASDKYNNRPIVNFPDFQFRAFLNNPTRINFKRNLHEKIESYNSYLVLPTDDEYCIYHDKTIEKQVETNIKYNKNFSIKENQGFKLSI